MKRKELALSHLRSKKQLEEMLPKRLRSLEQIGRESRQDARPSRPVRQPRGPRRQNPKHPDTMYVSTDLGLQRFRTPGRLAPERAVPAAAGPL